MAATLPCPKMPKQPSMKRCSRPSRCTCCAARKRISACATVSSGMRPLLEQRLELLETGVVVGAGEPRRRDRPRRIGEGQRPIELVSMDQPVRQRATERIAGAEAVHDLQADP